MKYVSMVIICNVRYFLFQYITVLSDNSNKCNRFITIYVYICPGYCMQKRRPRHGTSAVGIFRKNHFFFQGRPSAALKLYTGLMTSMTSTVSPMAPMISSMGLYAMGASSRVSSFAVVVYMPSMLCL